MIKLTFVTLTAAVLLSMTAASADPVQIRDSDEGYSRLSRWEQHLDDTIADRVRQYRIDPRRAWSIQKELDRIEARVEQAYYESDEGIDYATFRRYAGELRGIGEEIGEADWGSRNVYGDGWHDDRDSSNWGDRR
jgi:hypothetical protein